MDARIRTELGVKSTEKCPVAAFSSSIGDTISDVRRAAVPDKDGNLVEEFTVPDDCSIGRSDVDQVFSSEAHTVYQFTRTPDCDCVCRTIEAHGCPISDIHARDGILYVSFHAPDVKTIQSIVAALQETFPAVHVRHLTRGDEQTKSDLVLIDRGQLTRKQRAALETAHSMGYFEHPKSATAVEVASTIDIAPATFTEHIAAAQRKIFDKLLDS